MGLRNYSGKSDLELIEEYSKSRKLYENLPNRLAMKWLFEMSFIKAELLKRGVFNDNFRPID